MRDDTHKWPLPDPISEGGINLQECSIRALEPDRFTLISGPPSVALRIAGCERAWGWPDIVQGETYALSLRQDRVLIINGPEIADGWHDGFGVAVSDLSAGFYSFELEGPGALSVLSHLSEVNIAEQSASVVRMINAMPVMIYQHGTKDRIRLHCQISRRPTLLEALQATDAGWRN